MPSKQQLTVIGAVVGVFLLISFGAWFLVSRAPVSSKGTSGGSTGLGGSATKSVGVASSGNDTKTNQITTLGQDSKQKIFKIAEGPVAGATLVQTTAPTTTVARYVLQDSGHVLDQPLDVPGSLPRAASNTTIPGAGRALWSANGGALYLQYLDNTVMKTVALIFPPQASAKVATQPVRLQFFPDNVEDIAFSPDGTQAAYFLKTSSGVDAYISAADGTGSKKLFSLGLSQVLLSWPSPNTLMIATKSASDAAGIVFSADIKSGAVLPLIYANGITATADRSFNFVVYQTSALGQSSKSSYIHSVKNNTDSSLSFDPIPEKCAWSPTGTSTLYCAAPLSFVGADYLDQWHLGLASAADSIISFGTDRANKTDVIAVPGSSDGGVNSDILSLSVSQDGRYLIFIKKGDRSLWGVRLTQ